MFLLQNRRYTGAKTRLLNEIYKCANSIKIDKKLTFIDIFAGTGVVGGFFWENTFFKNIIVNDFLYSNYVIYNAFWKGKIDNKIIEIYNYLNNIKSDKDLYFKDNFGGKFWSKNDAAKIGAIRDELDILLRQNKINQIEFYTLLASLIYSADKIANTVGHYDAYRKNIELSDKFKFDLISPLKQQKKSIKIYQKDSNMLAQELAKDSNNFGAVAFLDPPYNSRQYSRFYHLLENLAKNEKPKLFGIAKKPKAENLSEFCTANAPVVFADLINNLANFCNVIILTYNNTNSANQRSNNRISKDQILNILNSVGKTYIKECDFMPFNSGKTNTKTAFANYKERIFICKI